MKLLLNKSKEQKWTQEDEISLHSKVAELRLRALRHTCSCDPPSKPLQHPHLPVSPSNHTGPARPITAPMTQYLCQPSHSFITTMSLHSCLTLQHSPCLGSSIADLLCLQPCSLQSQLACLWSCLCPSEPTCLLTPTPAT